MPLDPLESLCISQSHCPDFPSCFCFASPSAAEAQEIFCSGVPVAPGKVSDISWVHLSSPFTVSKHWIGTAWALECSCGLFVIFYQRKKFPMPRISCWHQVAGLSKGLNYWVLNTVGPWVLGQNILFKTWSWAPLKILLWLHMMFDLKCWPFLTELEYIYILWVWRGTEGGVTSI